MNLKLGEISDVVEGQLFGDPEIIIRNLHIDSRKYIPPVGSAFIALKGERNNGHLFLNDLIEKGIRSFIVEEMPARPVNGQNYIVVRNCLEAMQLLAAYLRQKYSHQVTAITGSNGKTILKEWLYQAYSRKYRVFRSPESYNSQVGVPLSVFMLDQESDLAILEAGISKKGEMDKLERIIRPDRGIITNIGSAHQENFSDLKEKIKEKLILFRNAEEVIYCNNYTEINSIIKQQLPAKKLICWGKDEGSDFKVQYELLQEGSIIKFRGEIEHDFRLHLSDHASLENASHLIVCLLLDHFETWMIQEILDQLEPVAMRMEIISGTGNSTIINDTYNSDLKSLENALDYLSGQNQHKQKTLILSDILQSGIPAKEMLKAIEDMVRNRNISKFIGIGNDFYTNAEHVPQDWSIYLDTESFIGDLKTHQFANQVILLKGSRKYRFERISALLQEKTHRTILEIDLNALVDNYRFYRSVIPKGTRVMAMVKAFSYGSGGYEVASALQYNKVDYLAVAYADEGVGLRKNGIHLPIMVMNPEKQDFRVMLENNLEPEIYGQRILKEFKSFLKRNAVSSFPVHLKLDTGMHRLGFENKDMESLLAELQEGPLRVVSVFSHLAAAEDPHFDSFTLDQISRFTSMCNLISKLHPHNFLRHILNTPGVERFPEASMDMVRLGIGLYGISDIHARNLKEVSTFKTTISQVKELDSDQTVGYGRAGKLTKRTPVGTLPVGYADGIPRSVGNGVGKFWIRGKQVPLIGNVCMDMAMVDLSGTDAVEGDEVIIFGNDYSVRNLAEAAGTISYEILTSISQRVKRVYYIE